MIGFSWILWMRRTHSNFFSCSLSLLKNCSVTLYGQGSFTYYLYNFWPFKPSLFLLMKRNQTPTSFWGEYYVIMDYLHLLELTMKKMNSVNSRILIIIFQLRKILIKIYLKRCENFAFESISGMFAWGTNFKKFVENFIYFYNVINHQNPSLQSKVIIWKRPLP